MSKTSHAAPDVAAPANDPAKDVIEMKAVDRAVIDHNLSVANSQKLTDPPTPERVPALAAHGPEPNFLPDQVIPISWVPPHYYQVRSLMPTLDQARRRLAELEHERGQLKAFIRREERLLKRDLPGQQLLPGVT